MRARGFRSLGGMVLPGVALLASLTGSASSAAAQIPVLGNAVNDFAGMMPRPSADDLTERLRRFKAETGYTVAVLTVYTLDNKDMEIFGRRAFLSLPLADADRSKSLLLLVAVKERKVGVQTGPELARLFPEPATTRKLTAQVGLYLNGMRRDLGIYAGVNLIFRAIRGRIRMDAVTEAERLEEVSIKGGEAGAIFSLFLAPYLAFVVGVLWGIYSTNIGADRGLRLIMGAALSYGTAKCVAILATALGSYSDGLWYFILAASATLGLFGSLTEFWMSGDWSGIPKFKDRNTLRNPTEKIGI